MTDLREASPATLRRSVGRCLGAVSRQERPQDRVRYYERAGMALDLLDARTSIEDDDGRRQLAALERRYQRTRAAHPAPPTRHPLP